MGTCHGGGGASGSNSMNVDFDKWGEEVNYPLKRIGTDGIEEQYGFVEDKTHYIMEPDIQKINKKQILDDINAWKNDDGTYGDNDTSIFIQYDDGSYYDSGDNTYTRFENDIFGDVKPVSTEKKGTKGFKKAGIIGASISTGDYKSVWGDEFIGRGNNRKRVPMTAEGEDGKEYSNSILGYKATGMYRYRLKTTFEKDKNGLYKPKYETIRKSKVKKI